MWVGAGQQRPRPRLGEEVDIDKQRLEQSNVGLMLGGGGA